MIFIPGQSYIFKADMNTQKHLVAILFSITPKLPLGLYTGRVRVGHFPSEALRLHGLLNNKTSHCSNTGMIVKKTTPPLQKNVKKKISLFVERISNQSHFVALIVPCCLTSHLHRTRVSFIQIV